MAGWIPCGRYSLGRARRRTRLRVFHRGFRRSRRRRGIDFASEKAVTVELIVWIVVALALGYGALRLFQARARRQADQQARTDKRTKSAIADAKAMQKSIDGRR